MVGDHERVSTFQQLRRLVEEGLYYLTEHAYAEALDDALDIYDVEHALLTGQIHRRWSEEHKVEVVGEALDWMGGR